jgi:hypothetical protein
MLPYSKNLKHLARDLRTGQTDAEQRLWFHIRRKQNRPMSGSTARNPSVPTSSIFMRRAQSWSSKSTVRNIGKGSMPARIQRGTRISKVLD